MAPKTKQPKRNPKKVKRVRFVPKSPMLDAQGASYARLLADPCNAPLAHPVYGGTNGGLLLRSRSVFSVNTAPTATAGYLHWTPGAIGTATTELLGAEYATTSIGGNAIAITTAPGKAFLVANSASYRPVAACMQVYFLGAETARSGFVLVDNTLGGLIDLGTAYSTDILSRTLSNYSRTPGNCLEAVFKPAMGDETWIDAASATAPVDKDRRGAITIAWGGLPAGVSLSIVLTGVYEWVPNPASGLSSSTESRSSSHNDVRDVMDYLVNRGTQFVRGIGAELATGALAGGIAYAQRTNRRQISM